MSESIDDRLAAAIAHDSMIARAVSAPAATLARAWDASAVRRWWQSALEAFRPLTLAERRQCGLIALAATVGTRVLLLIL